MLPYFIRSENHQYYDTLDTAYHGNEGPLSVGQPKAFKTPFSEGFIAACAAEGIAPNTDYNGASQAGAGLVHCTIHNGKRASAAVAFLKPALTRKNLQVLTKAQVIQINFDGKKAVGLPINRAVENRSLPQGER